MTPEKWFIMTGTRASVRSAPIWMKWLVPEQKTLL